MSTDHRDAGPAPADDRRRYGELTTDTGECIIYDRENTRAWIQSTVAASLGELD